VNNLQYIRQYSIYALIALLFTCVTGLKQDYKPITFKHHFDASISEYSFEFDTEESAPEEPVPPQNIALDYHTDFFTDNAKPRPRGHFKTSLNYATPLTRAPPIA